MLPTPKSDTEFLSTDPPASFSNGEVVGLTVVELVVSASLDVGFKDGVSVARSGIKRGLIEEGVSLPVFIVAVLSVVKSL